MAGITKGELLEERYILEGKILTSLSYDFVKFGIKLAKMLGLEISQNIFGL